MKKVDMSKNKAPIKQTLRFAGIVLLLVVVIIAIYIALTPNMIQPRDVQTDGIPGDSKPATTQESDDNPFETDKTFLRRETENEQSAILAIDINADYTYVIKERITGDILSKGMWNYDTDTKKITMTQTDGYPIYNTFKVDIIGSEDTKTQISKMNKAPAVKIISVANNTTDETAQYLYKLTYIAEESNNVQFNLLTNGDVFEQEEKIDTEPKIEIDQV